MADIYRLNVRNSETGGFEKLELRDSRFDALSDAYGELSSTVSRVSDNVVALNSNRPRYVDYVVLASKWKLVGGEWVYSFEESYGAAWPSFPAKMYDISVEPDENVTGEQYSAWCGAGIVGGNGATNQMRAMLVPPQVDVPVIVRIEQKYDVESQEK